MPINIWNEIPHDRSLLLWCETMANCSAALFMVIYNFTIAIGKH
jgi:hypothetical protein